MGERKFYYADVISRLFSRYVFKVRVIKELWLYNNIVVRRYRVKSSPLVKRQLTSATTWDRNVDCRWRATNETTCNFDIYKNEKKKTNNERIKISYARARVRIIFRYTVIRVAYILQRFHTVKVPPPLRFFFLESYCVILMTEYIKQNETVFEKKKKPKAKNNNSDRPRRLFP